LMGLACVTPAVHVARVSEATITRIARSFIGRTSNRLERNLLGGARARQRMNMRFWDAEPSGRNA
jgi:hypothetical protein